jgi:protein-S-isoprenylcysteine O-methyltransferase Ste14
MLITKNILRNRGGYLSLSQIIRMPLQSLIIIVSFSFMGLALLVDGFLLRNKTSHLLGIPTIDKFYFYSGKIAVFCSWAFMIMKAMFPWLGYSHEPVILLWFGVFLAALGSVIMSAAFFSLGTSLKVGLPQEETALMTKGIYRVSRNPIYVGVDMICIASVIYFPNILNIVVTAYGIAIHHSIIRGEEKFLAVRFGEKWKEYSSRVRRYF